MTSLIVVIIAKKKISKVVIFLLQLASGIRVD